jgi:hypothetical protein
VTLREELFLRLARDLSRDIAVELNDGEVNILQVLDKVVPKGSPGSQFHRPVLSNQLQDLKKTGAPLELVTCLQIVYAFDWPVGLLPDD